MEKCYTNELFLIELCTVNFIVFVIDAWNSLILILIILYYILIISIFQTPEEKVSALLMVE